MAHTPPEDRRASDLSGHGKKLTERGPLTSWRPQKEVLVRIRIETGRARPTHSLQNAEGEDCQATQRNLPSEAHSPAGDGRGRDLSGHGKKQTERAPLTN